LTNSKIKIAFIIDQLNTGGTERQLKYLIEGLDNTRFDKVLFLLRGNILHPFKPKGTKTYVLNVKSLFSLEGIKKLFYFSRLLKKNRIQIVQTFFQDATIFGVLAAKFARVNKIVVSIRDMRFWATPFNVLAHRMATLLSDYILVNSFAIKKDLERCILSNKIQVIHNGIHDYNYSFDKKLKSKQLEKLEIAKGRPVVVMVSNCNRKVKRVDLLIESIPLIIKEMPVSFLVVGDGSFRTALERRAFELNIQSYIKFLGPVRNIDSILAISDIAVNTSDSEGLSNSIMEAMRASLPVVASDVAGNKELVKNNVNGLLFTAGDSQDLATKILALLKNHILATRFGQNGRKFINSKFSVKNMINLHMIFYYQLLLNK
jgi:glycosyltransferase involved in cell wall biosynthesis